MNVFTRAVRCTRCGDEALQVDVTDDDEPLWMILPCECGGYLLPAPTSVEPVPEAESEVWQ